MRNSDWKENTAGATVISKYDYAVNNVDQRTGVDVSGTAFGSAAAIAWGYDALGQVIKADHPTAAKDFGYKFDGIGNRKRSSRNTTNPDTATGANLAVYRQDTASAGPEGGNTLNQYGRLELYGAAAENNTHDDDGNQLAGRFATASTPAGTRTWDGENQLITTSPVGAATTYYTYDAFRRRVAKRTSASDVTYTLYDAWNPVADYTGAATPALHSSYTWGPDLSGTFQSAGGVGGLLAVRLHTGTPATYFPTYDGNGNISEYLNASGTWVAHYEYGPFGELTAATGSLATTFRHRFSTKPLDTESGYYYYGYRSYDPLSGRWLNRDPIGEVIAQHSETDKLGFNEPRCNTSTLTLNTMMDFLKLYVLSNNNAIGKHDFLGLMSECECAEACAKWCGTGVGGANPTACYRNCWVKRCGGEPPKTIPETPGRTPSAGGVMEVVKGILKALANMF